jgi:5'-methylthioadenosine phosphorylase
MKVKVGVIGGAGYYSPDFLEDKRIVKIKTPYGKPSSDITTGVFSGKCVAFLPRHGEFYKRPSRFVNFRANIWALKKLGVQQVIAPCAVGSLNSKLKVGCIAIPNQLIDFTKKREDTFANAKKLLHPNMHNSFDVELMAKLAKAVKESKISVSFGSYLCIEGPRFSSLAEKRFFRKLGADMVGMDLYPENILAKEASLKYASFALITDDAFKEPVDDLLAKIFDVANKKKALVESIIKKTIKLI